MNEFKTLQLESKDGISTIWLNRPEKRNAFNLVMLNEITEAFNSLAEMQNVRAIVLRGHGKAFCSGADLAWMKSGMEQSLEHNYNECLDLFDCFHSIYSNPKPTICVVHGAVIGGANGLAASCDITLAKSNTSFSLSEVKIGLIPACIAPFILKRIGEFKTRELMLTGRRFKEEEAEKIGLINKLCEEGDCEAVLDTLIGELMSAGPEALKQCKELIYNITNVQSYDEARPYTARKIAEVRKSPEGQEGMQAFLEKRKPNWRD